jgi:hypothetical protein
MTTALEQQLAQPVSQKLSFEERIALLLDQEILYRDNRRLTRLLKAARLRMGACVEDIDVPVQTLTDYLTKRAGHNANVVRR